MRLDAVGAPVGLEHPDRISKTKEIGYRKVLKVQQKSEKSAVFFIFPSMDQWKSPSSHS